MQPDERVRGAIDRAYVVFGLYPRPLALQTSPLRDGREILRTLTQAPLRDLRYEAIGPYAGWALTTVGNVGDYKHFLPRILEQAVIRDTWLGTAPPIIAERLKMGDWEAWPADEKAAITSFFTAAWGQASRRHPNDADAVDWLCGIAALGLDVRVALTDWLRPPTIEAALQAARFLSMAPARIVGPGGSDGGYWTYVDDETCRSIGEWLASQEVCEALLRAADEVEPEDRWTLESGLKTAARLRQ